MKARFFVLLISLIASLLLTLKLAAADPKGWIQINVSGFGESENYAVQSLAPFKGQFYAGTRNDSGSGAQLWRRNSLDEWTRITGSGFADPGNTNIASLANFNSRLYAGTQNDTSGGQVWRSDDGMIWSKVTLDGFDPINKVVVHFAEFENEIYASTGTFTITQGAEIWRSSTGDSGDWAEVVSNGFDGDVNNDAIISFEEYGGNLFAGTDNIITGAEVWYMDDAGEWHQINTDGFGDHFNWSATLKGFKGYLYAGTYNYGWNDNYSDNPGLELWRCQKCDGTDWQNVPFSKGFGSIENRALRAFKVLNGALYAVTFNGTDGTQVWRSVDGNDWSQINSSGFGDSNNDFILWDNAATVYDGSLYVGTFNYEDGGEIWKYQTNDVFLPMVLRDN